MTKKAFDQIMEGLDEALAFARGEAGHSIGVAGYEQIKARTMTIARGERRARPGEPKVWIVVDEQQMEGARKVMKRRRNLLRALAKDASEDNRHEETSTGPAVGNEFGAKD
jgi:hypothetical protein